MGEINCFGERLRGWISQTKGEGKSVGAGTGGRPGGGLASENADDIRGESPLTLPVLPVHLLWVNMTTAIVLGLWVVFEPLELGLMSRGPRDPRAPIFDTALFIWTGIVSATLLGGSFWVFFYEQRSGASIAQTRTAVLNTVVAVACAYLVNCRSLRRSVWRIGFLRNPLLTAGIAASVLLQLVFRYAPAMNRFFQTAPVDLEPSLRIVGVALGVFLVVELEKRARHNG